MAVAVVSEEGGINQKQRESDHHQHGEPPDLLETDLQNEAYPYQQLNENQ